MQEGRGGDVHEVDILARQQVFVVGVNAVDAAVAGDPPAALAVAVAQGDDARLRAGGVALQMRRRSQAQPDDSDPDHFPLPASRRRRYHGPAFGGSVRRPADGTGRVVR